MGRRDSDADSLGAVPGDQRVRSPGIWKRANALIPRAKRSRTISRVLATFLDRIATKRLEQEYVAYYTNRPARELQDEHDLLAAWDLSDSEAWATVDARDSTVAFLR